jgi:GEVED domain
MQTFKTILLLAFFGIIIFSNKLMAQGGIAINDAGTAPNASAILDVSASAKGMLVPRMSLAERIAITSPASGLMVFQVAGTPAAPQGFYYHDGSKWIKVEEQLTGIVLQPSTIVAGDGFTLSAVSTGKNIIDYTASAFTNVPTVLVTPEFDIVGTAPVITSYCTPSFAFCNVSTVDRDYINGIIVYQPAVALAANIHLSTTTSAGCPSNGVNYTNNTLTPFGVIPCLTTGANVLVRTTRDLVAAQDNVTIWIDYNQDGFYTTSEIEGQSTAGSNNYDATFSLGNPNAYNGNTFMRVMTRNSGVIHNQPCFVQSGPGDKGETEDVKICITGGLPAAYANDHNYCNISNITNTQTTVNCFNKQGTLTNKKYHFKIISND